jgi:hypothetical protein
LQAVDMGRNVRQHGNKNTGIGQRVDDSSIGPIAQDRNERIRRRTKKLCTNISESLITFISCKVNQTKNRSMTIP